MDLVMVMYRDFFRYNASSNWQVPKELDTLDYLDAIKNSMEDLWEDAEMAEVCRYLYGNRNMKIPEEYKQYLPQFL